MNAITATNIMNAISALFMGMAIVVLIGSIIALWWFNRKF